MQETTCIVGDGQELLSKLSESESTHTIMKLQPIGDRRIMLRLRPNTPMMNTRGNVFIGTVTTQKGQLRLVQSLLTIDEQVLYCDTDSAIYFTTPLYPDRLKLGHFIGDWSNELSPYDKQLQILSHDSSASTMLKKVRILASKAYAKMIAARHKHHIQFMRPIIECKLKV